MRKAAKFIARLVDGVVIFVAALLVEALLHIALALSLLVLVVGILSVPLIWSRSFWKLGRYDIPFRVTWDPAFTDTVSRTFTQTAELVSLAYKEVPGNIIHALRSC